MADRVRIGLVLPDVMGTYGDGGNAVVLRQRLRLRGIPAEIVEITLADPVPDSLDLYTLGGATVEGAGVVEVHHEAGAGDVAAEVGALLRTLDGHAMWEEMMADPTVDLSEGPAGAFLAYIAEQVDPPIGHLGDANIGVDGGERVRRRERPAPGERVVQRRLPGIR